MLFPDSVYAVIQEEADKHKEDIRAAVDAAMARIVKLPEYDSIVQDLVRKAIHKLVYDYRHQCVRETKGKEPMYSVQPRIVVGRSAAVHRVERSYYDIFVCGKTLGSMLGKELLPAAEHERRIGQGHLVNARLLERLSKIVPEDKTVRNSVSERRIKHLLKACQSECGRTAAC